VRVALQALAAVLGGCQSLHCNGRDEALSLPSEESARIALRTQQIIAAETGVTHTVDPVGGSYTIERLTDTLERQAASILDRIDRLGGALAAIEQGWIQREIQDAAYRTQQAVDRGTQVVVGVNRFQSEDGRQPSVPDAFVMDPGVEARQVERLRHVRAGRSEAEWRHGLDAVAAAARDGTNLVPPIVAAVQALATIGEISDTLRSVFGEYVEVPAL
jgi:methylmalonyl-CoA mutase N-terminal domain/subunit